MLYDGEVVPNVRALNGHLGGKPLYMSTGTSHLLWDVHTSCFIPLWDSPYAISSGEPCITPDEVVPLLLDVQRVSAACRYDRRIVIGCPMSRWDKVFVIGPCGKYVKGLKRFEQYMASRGASMGKEAEAPVWLEHDRTFATNIYAGEIIRTIKAFNPEQGGKRFSIAARPAWNHAVCYFPFGDSPYVLARNEILIRPSEVKPLLLEMQRVAQELAYPYEIDVKCRGSDLSFAIGPAGRYVMGCSPFEEDKRKRAYAKWPADNDE